MARSIAEADAEPPVPTPSSLTGPNLTERADHPRFSLMARAVHGARAMRPYKILVSVVLLGTAWSCKATEAADSPDPAASDTWKITEAASGSRLHARFISGGDARAHVGFFDTARNEACTFQPAEQHRMRCLPETVSYVDGSTFFADATCTTPLRAIPTTCSDAKYAVATTYDQTTCKQETFEIRRITGPAAAFANGNNGCARVQAPLVAVGEVVPWTEFVYAVSTPAPGTNGLGEALLVADDGARQHASFRTDKLDDECTFEIMADGVTRCVPQGGRGPAFYSDDACTTPAAAFTYDNQPCIAPVKSRWLEVAPTPTGTTCNEVRAVYPFDDSSQGIGDTPDVYAYYPGSGIGGDGTCTLQRSYGSQGTRHAFGPDLTPTLPVATRVNARNGRLSPALVSADGTRTLTPGWHDNERNVDCTFMLATDGKMRCLPSATQAKLFFTDDACKSPTQIAVPTAASCTGTDSPYALLTSSTCPPTTTVLTLGKDRRDLSAASTETAPGRCVKIAGLGGAYDATVVDPAGFVEGVAGND